MTKIVSSIKEVRKNVESWKKEGLQIGFVPTMGYLHQGHESLIERAVNENDRVVVSIFINPIQFGPKEDLESYPRDLEHDIALCQRAGVNLVFNPEVEEIFPSDFCTHVDMDRITRGLCGKNRPTHFSGVCTIVNKLFNIVDADSAYFGQKDAQQLAVIKRMVKDLNIDIKIVGCPIIREEDGLAKSSRNFYLSKEERKAALILFQSIQLGRQLILKGEKNVQAIILAITRYINTEPLARIDYVDVVDVHSMEHVDQIENSVLVAIAVFIGKTRLIDNFILD
jgi:pantoate--beta-alanine ligase